MKPVLRIQFHRWLCNRSLATDASGSPFYEICPPRGGSDKNSSSVTYSYHRRDVCVCMCVERNNNDARDCPKFLSKPLTFSTEKLEIREGESRVHMIENGSNSSGIRTQRDVLSFLSLFLRKNSHNEGFMFLRLTAASCR